ncbi:hypothetical protein HPP92_025719 [Vanilla planifolia]|uniref:RING-type domain-containing protein n=1 Tax=Vanilla planifolia TaxID=51239 RepID=A0A835PIE0_VANPL|nr:hypothetical protein HPP92_025719 [Vanilla planifolia]
MLPKPLVVALFLLGAILHFLSAVLYQIGLNPSFEAERSPWEDVDIIFSDEITPAVISSAAAEWVKSKLPVVEYAGFVRRRVGSGGAMAVECAVCLQFVEAKDEVRELGNCRHAFHVPCLDSWIDLGKFNCPLCRSKLVPQTAGRYGGRGARGVLKFLISGNGF